MRMTDTVGYCSAVDSAVTPPRAAALAGKTWSAPGLIRCGFLDGPAEYRDRVQVHCRAWEEGTGVRFRWVQFGAADVRITFAGPTGRFYSLIGTDGDSPGFGADGHTMALGFPPGWRLGTEAVEREIRRLILHEFGHALGLVHEHSSPEAGAFFREPALVYDYYRRTQGWDRATVDQNVLAHYRSDQIGLRTDFDAGSIMLYWFPAEITTRPTSVNYELSDGDRALAAALYPPG